MFYNTWRSQARIDKKALHAIVRVYVLQRMKGIDGTSLLSVVAVDVTV